MHSNVNFAIMEAMILYLVRHAEAVNRDSGDAPDDLRVLTPMGRSVMEKTAKWCVDEHLLIEQIVTSPLVRAVQTAEILAAALHPRENVVIAPSLGTAGSAGQLQRLVTQHQHLNSLMLVGHEPTVGIAASVMLDIEKKVVFPPGAVCALSFHGAEKSPQASFRWMASAARDAAGGFAVTSISAIELL